MSQMLDLSGLPEDVVRILQDTVRRGQAGESAALSSLESLAAQAQPRRSLQDTLTPDEWIAHVRKWAELHDRDVKNVDFSRESIY